MPEETKQTTFTLTINKSSRNPNYDPYNRNKDRFMEESTPLFLNEQVLMFTVTEEEFIKIRNIIALGLVVDVKTEGLTSKEFEQAMKWQLPASD